MQTYPARYAIEAPYRFTGFDKQAVDTVLAQLIPERLHLWEIDQAQSVSESLYFYDGQYSVEPLALSTPAERRAQVAQYGLKLPAQNRLLPEQFKLADAPSQPELVVDEEASIWLRGSEAFADLPRGLYPGLPQLAAASGIGRDCCHACIVG